MQYALLLFALYSAASADTDLGLPKENIAPPCAHPQQVVEAHFQLGSGAGSESQPHGNEYNEPAISLGHPHSSSVSREYRNTEVTARNLQDIQLQSISGIFNKIMSTLTSVGIPPFYVALWPIGVMLIFVYIHMLPGAGAAAAASPGRDRPPRFNPADNRYSFRAYLQDVRDWVARTNRPAHSQAFALISALEGHARGVAGQLQVEELMQGGYVDGLQFDPVSYLPNGSGLSEPT